MIRLFLTLTLISIVITIIWSSDGYTVHNSLLTGHVFKTVESIDWLQCVEECHKHDECISYNYFPPEKIGALITSLRRLTILSEPLDGFTMYSTNPCKHVLPSTFIADWAKRQYHTLHSGQSTKKLSKKRISFSSFHLIVFKRSKGLFTQAHTLLARMLLNKRTKQI